MRVLYNAVEGEKWAVAGGDRIIITYNKETSTRRWVTCLGRGEGDLLSFGVFGEPQIVRPDGAQLFAKRCFDLPDVLLAMFKSRQHLLHTLLPLSPRRRNVQLANKSNAYSTSVPLDTNG